MINCGPLTLNLDVYFIYYIYFSLDMIQDGKAIHLLHWEAASRNITKLYKADHLLDWSGIMWYGNNTQIPTHYFGCGWDNEMCEQKSGDEMNSILIYLSCSFVILLVLSIGIGIFYVKHVKRNAQISFLQSILLASSEIKTEQLSGYPASQFGENVIYKEETLIRELFNNIYIDLKDNTIVKELIQMQELTNVNICTFVGICVDEGCSSLFMMAQSRGSLFDIIAQDDSIELTFDFKTSILTDIACGMAYLHQSSVGSHGRLTSHNCLLDSRWTCKITRHGLATVRERAESQNKPDMEQLLWTAPEFLRKNKEHVYAASRKGDVFSYGIIVQEVICEGQPYCYNSKTIEEIIGLVLVRCKPPFRPNIPSETPDNWQDLMQCCWSDDAQQRPEFSRVLYMLCEIDKTIDQTLVEKIVDRLEKHTHRLEVLVEKRKVDIKHEQHKMEYLLSELLPPSVIAQLQKNQKVQPEAFDTSSLFFSDIVGFTKIAAKCSPLQTVEMLGEMYTLFDQVASGYDVYKIATIGDAYMVSSGVPIRNGTRHASEICGMALDLLGAIQKLAIPHLLGEHLHLRIGIHSGPCVGAVVGVKMPRYFLFGETVDFASKMESGGQPMMVHISEETNNIIQGDNIFLLESRGMITMTGKGLIQTFWLLGRMTKC